MLKKSGPLLLAATIGAGMMAMLPSAQASGDASVCEGDVLDAQAVDKAGGVFVFESNASPQMLQQVATKVGYTVIIDGVVMTLPKAILEKGILHGTFIPVYAGSAITIPDDELPW